MGHRWDRSRSNSRDPVSVLFESRRNACYDRRMKVYHFLSKYFLNVFTDYLTKNRRNKVDIGLQKLSFRVLRAVPNVAQNKFHES